MAYTGEREIAVRDQTNSDPANAVVIPRVISQGAAYVVVLDQAGNVLGYKAISDGVNDNVEVKLNATPSSQPLYATLNKGGAVRKPWWTYPFDPDADYTSSRFLDPRTPSPRAAGPKSASTIAGKSWLDDERSAHSIVNGQPNPDYSRQACMDQLALQGYPSSTASFYCD